MIRAYNLHPTLREQITGLPRKKIHVCKPTVENYEYLYKAIPRGQLFHTILEALAVAQAYEDVIVWPGQYKETATIAITQDSLKLLAAEMGPFGRCLTQTEIRQYGNVDTPCISVEGAHNVEIAGFRITPYDPGTDSVAINVGLTANTYGIYIHNNYFYGVGSGATGPCFVQLGVVDSFNADSAFVYRNDFYCGGSTNDSIGQLMWNSAVGCRIVENNFWTQGNAATCYGIVIDDAAGQRGGIFDNRFMNIEVGLDGSAGCAIKNPTMTGAGVYIDGNKFINWDAEANCIANRTDECIGLNYWNEHAIAGA